MKLAIVCDDLIQFGGAEKIVEELSDMYPNAPIYTRPGQEIFVEKKGNSKRYQIRHLPLPKKLLNRI